MKDIVEIWRKFLSEGEQIEKLRILDFDDTIAETDEQVKLYIDGGRDYRMLDSDEFAIYNPKEGEYYDDSSFYQFDDVDVDKAKPISFIVNILRNFISAPGSRKVLILTARNQEAENGIRNFLRSIDIDDSAVDVVGVGNKEPIEKVKAIDDYLNNRLEGVKFVSFFDDSGPNVQAVKQYLSDLGIQHDVAKVEEDEIGDRKLTRI